MCSSASVKWTVKRSANNLKQLYVHIVLCNNIGMCTSIPNHNTIHRVGGTGLYMTTAHFLPEVLVQVDPAVKIMSASQCFIGLFVYWFTRAVFSSLHTHRCWSFQYFAIRNPKTTLLFKYKMGMVTHTHRSVQVIMIHDRFQSLIRFTFRFCSDHLQL